METYWSRAWAHAQAEVGAVDDAHADNAEDEGTRHDECSIAHVHTASSKTASDRASESPAGAMRQAHRLLFGRLVKTGSHSDGISATLFLRRIRPARAA